MNQSPLSQLAQLLLKNHFELRELLASTSTSLLNDPVKVGVRMGSARGTMSLGQSSKGLELSFTENGRGYRVVMPLRAAAGEPFKVKVTLTDGDKSHEQEFEGLSLFSATMPEEFGALHARVVDYLKKSLPAALLEKLRAHTGSSVSATAAQTTSEASAPSDSDTESVQPAAAATPQEADPFSWYHVRRDDQPDLKFRGKSVARVDSALRNGRQTVLEVFVTPSGKYVGMKLGLSMWVGERDIATVQLADKPEDLVPFFGFSPLAKVLYERLELRTAEVVE